MQEPGRWFRPPPSYTRTASTSSRGTSSNSVFRPLFFRRYEAILTRRADVAILLNASVFSFAHLMYWSWVVAGMTWVGGLIFAYSYRMRGNFPEAVIAHSLAGIVIFALGLGVFFYSGNVSRPF